MKAMIRRLLPTVSNGGKPKDLKQECDMTTNLERSKLHCKKAELEYEDQVRGFCSDSSKG